MDLLDRPAPGGGRGLRATLAHVIRNMEAWGGQMTGRSLEDGVGGDRGGESVPELRARLDAAAADLASLSRAVADRGGWDETWTDPAEDPPVRRSYGGTIAHVITHSMHHRAQLLAMLRALGVPDVPEGDVLGWEALTRPPGDRP